MREGNMIRDEEIEAKAAELSLTPNEVEKDYVHGWVLRAIASRPQLANTLVLKGGSALRKGYLPNTRFSKDLDFSSLTAVDKTFLDAELHEICKIVSVQTGVAFLDRTLIKDKNLPIPDVNALEARIYFKGFYNEESILLKTQLDITEFDKIYLPIQARALLHPYSDAPSCQATIRCHKIEEILASKLTTLLHRRKAVDMFDLLYAIVFTKEYQVTRREVITTFLKKSIFEPQPHLAKNELLAVPLEEFRPSWTSILSPLRSGLDFGFVVANFGALIESLFNLLVPVPAFAAGGGGRGFGLDLGAVRAGSVWPTVFSGGVRNILMEAGRNREIVELRYDGYMRLVEPYRLEYYRRKSDGRGAEYFWGFDMSGGKSGKIGIKQFFCDKIQSARSIGRTFVPRFPIAF
jgi:predicted nucleotidyltransferase component of viral defense system